MADANAAQRHSWEAVAGPKWLARAALLDQSHAAVADALWQAAALRPGETVLEVGCGTGSLLPEIARRVGPRGQVNGIDISAPLLAAAVGLPANATIRLADAQTAAFMADRDVIVSRFGVMFFADPVAAFANLHTALRPGGRLCFACWAALARNPHWATALAVAARYLRAPEPPPAEAPPAPGPFAFADPVRVAAILTAAGFSAIDVRPCAVALQTASLDDAVTLAMELGPAGALIGACTPDAATLAMIRGEISAGYRRWQRGAGVAFPGAVQIVTARG